MIGRLSSSRRSGGQGRRASARMRHPPENCASDGPPPANPSPLRITLAWARGDTRPGLRSGAGPPIPVEQGRVGLGTGHVGASRSAAPRRQTSSSPTAPPRHGRRLTARDILRQIAYAHAAISARARCRNHSTPARIRQSVVLPAARTDEADALARPIRQEQSVSKFDPVPFEMSLVRSQRPLPHGLHALRRICW